MNVSPHVAREAGELSALVWVWLPPHWPGTLPRAQGLSGKGWGRDRHWHRTHERLGIDPGHLSGVRKATSDGKDLTPSLFLKRPRS